MLAIVSVFDREVNVRRAAAAAFQENVGRQVSLHGAIFLQMPFILVNSGLTVSFVLEWLPE